MGRRSSLSISFADVLAALSTLEQLDTPRRRNLSSLCQNAVHRSGSGHVLGAVVAQREGIEVGEKVFAGAEEYRADRDMHFVDETGFEILADGGHTPTKPNILPVGRLAGAL